MLIFEISVLRPKFRFFLRSWIFPVVNFSEIVIFFDFYDFFCRNFVDFGVSGVPDPPQTPLGPPRDPPRDPDFRDSETSEMTFLTGNILFLFVFYLYIFIIFYFIFVIFYFSLYLIYEILILIRKFHQLKWKKIISMNEMSEIIYLIGKKMWRWVIFLWNKLGCRHLKLQNLESISPIVSSNLYCLNFFYLFCEIIINQTIGLYEIKFLKWILFEKFIF